MGYDQITSTRAAKFQAVPEQKKKVSARLILIGVVVLAVVGYGAYSFSGGGAGGGGKGGQRNAQSAPVRVATATTHDVPIEVHTIGTVLANSTVNIKAQVVGQMVSAKFKEGQMVKAGDLLFQIDPEPYQAALRQAQATTLRDQAQLSSAQADADRAVTLAQRGIVATQQRDQLVAAAKALAATLAADTAAVDRAKINVDYTTIRSPIDGKTGPILIQPGNQVGANDQLVTITQIQPVKITFDLPQTNLPQLQDRMQENGLIAGIAIRSDVAAAVATANDLPNPGKDITVKVDFIGNTVDEKTGTVELRATFDNPDLRLVPGELVDVSVQLETLKNVVTVPREAVNSGQNGSYVYVADKNNKVSVHPVNILYQDETLAALKSDIVAGDTVVTDGQLRLTPDAVVTIMGPPGSEQQGPPPGAKGKGKGDGQNRGKKDQ